MGEILVADLETNGLKPSRIWMVGILDYKTNEFTSYVGEDEVPIGLMRIAEAERVIGHNFRGYDKKVIEKLTDGLITLDNARIDDTVEISRSLFPTLQNHKLATWGEIFGYPKLDFNNFDEWDPLMIPYCQRDCELNKVLYDFFVDHIGANTHK